MIALWGALVTAAVTCAFISASCSGELSKDEAKEIIETSSHIICPSLVQVLLYADAPKQITAGGDTQVAYESSMQAAKLLHKAGLLTMRETGENGNTHYTLELSHKLERFIASKNENKLYVKLGEVNVDEVLCIIKPILRNEPKKTTLFRCRMYIKHNELGEILCLTGSVLSESDACCTVAKDYYAAFEKDGRRWRIAAMEPADDT